MTFAVAEDDGAGAGAGGRPPLLSEEPGGGKGTLEAGPSIADEMVRTDDGAGSDLAVDTAVE